MSDIPKQGSRHFSKHVWRTSIYTDMIYIGSKWI